MNDADPVTQLIETPIEFVGLREDLFRTWQHQADEKRLTALEQFRDTDCFAV